MLSEAVIISPPLISKSPIRLLGLLWKIRKSPAKPVSGFCEEYVTVKLTLGSILNLTLEQIPLSDPLGLVFLLRYHLIETSCLLED